MGREVLEPGCLYHIYNHAVGTEKLFLSEDNYHYFLRRYVHFISPVADTYAYCLMSNHIHFLVEVKNQIPIPENTRYSTRIEEAGHEFSAHYVIAFYSQPHSEYAVTICFIYIFIYAN